MTVAKLCTTVSGYSFREYLDVGRHSIFARTWHGAQCDVPDETLVGADLMESMGDGHAAPLVVPVALVNDHHFWGVIASQEEVIIALVDKGEYTAFRSPGGLGICPDPGERNACDESSDLDDGESPHVAYKEARKQLRSF